MKRLIINLNTEYNPMKLDRSLLALRNYLEMGRNGERITITWEDKACIVYHGNKEELAIFNWR